MLDPQQGPDPLIDKGHNREEIVVLPELQKINLREFEIVLLLVADRRRQMGLGLIDTERHRQCEVSVRGNILDQE